jgi:predicted Zn-dependent protease
MGSETQQYLRLTVLMVCLFLSPAIVSGQNRTSTEANPVRFADELFEQLFPAPTAEDEKALAEITISRADEQRLGENMVNAFLAELKRQKIKVVRRGKDVNYLQALVSTVQPFMRQADRYPEIEVYVVDSSIPDARSFPGGTLFFYDGLLDLARTEATMVGVVGHELSHLDHGHQLLPLKQSRFLEKSFVQKNRDFDPRQFFDSGTRIARLMSRPFRPQDEAAADSDAVTWMYAAGYDPREFSKLLERMHDRLAATERLPVPTFIRTHPPTLERAAAVLDQLNELQRKDPRADLYVGQTNLARRVPRREHEFPD